MLPKKIKEIIREVKRIASRQSIEVPLEYWEKAAIEDPFSAICTGYDEKEFETSKDSIVFQANMPLRKDFVVLEIGCGLGRTAKFVAPNVKKYVGVDFSKNMIEKAKKRNAKLPNVEFFINDGLSLDILESNQFDLVYCELVFQHVSKEVTRSYVKEAHRVLKPNGTFYAQFPNLFFYFDRNVSFTKRECEKLLTEYSDFQYLYKNQKNVPLYRNYYTIKMIK